MTSYYQHLNVAEMIWDAFGPTANPFDGWKRHDVFRFEGVRISQEAPVVRQPKGAEGRVRELAILRWGLVPPWFKGDEAGAKKFQTRTFNARGETAASKGSFKASWKSRRCLVPAFGFYEFIDEKVRLLEDYRKKIEERRAELTVTPEGYPPVKPPNYFGGDLLGRGPWKQFWNNIDDRAHHFREAIG